MTQCTRQKQCSAIAAQPPSLQHGDIVVKGKAGGRDMGAGVVTVTQERYGVDRGNENQ